MNVHYTKTFALHRHTEAARQQRIVKEAQGRGLVFEATLSVYGKIHQMPERNNFKLFEADRPSF